MYNVDRGDDETETLKIRFLEHINIATCFCVWKRQRPFANNTCRLLCVRIDWKNVSQYTKLPDGVMTPSLGAKQSFEGI